MITTLRRLFWLALLGGAGYAGWAGWQRRHAPAAAGAPEWPPLDPRPTPSKAAGATADGFAAFDTDGAGEDSKGEAPGNQGAPGAPDLAAAPSGARWVAPVDGECPEGFPIKANDNSGIYHVPGGRFYARTVPERCYARSQDAETDGYRAAKS